MLQRFSFALLALTILATPAVAQTSLLDFASADVSGTPDAIPSGGGANTLLSQAQNAVNGFFADSSFPQSIADNFFLNQGIGQDVAFLEWYGGFFPAPTGSEVLTVDIFVHVNAGGLPGSVVCTLDNAVPGATPTGVVLFGVPEIFYQLDVDLGDCNLPDNAIYWLELFNDVNPGGGNVYFWETGNLDGTNGIVDNVFAIEAPGVTWMPNPGELSLEIFADDKVPVELISFGAMISGTDVSLNWETASETNNAGFEVQIQKGESWDVLGFVGGNGTTTEAQTYSFAMGDLAIGTHTFRLKQIDFDGRFEYHGNVEVALETPGSHVLSAAYPNPFNPQSQFTLAVAQDQNVTAELFNTLGQRVAVLFDGTVEADQTQTLTIDGAGLASGMYVVRVNGERFVDALTVTLLK